jgi:hypothetical protein
MVQGAVRLDCTTFWRTTPVIALMARWWSPQQTAPYGGGSAAVLCRLLVDMRQRIAALPPPKFGQIDLSAVWRLGKSPFGVSLAKATLYNKDAQLGLRAPAGTKIK